VCECGCWRECKEKEYKGGWEVVESHGSTGSAEGSAAETLLELSSKMLYG